MRRALVLSCVALALGLATPLSFAESPGNAAHGNQNWLYYGAIAEAKVAKQVGVQMQSVCPTGYPTCFSDGSFTYAGVWSWHLYGEPLGNLGYLGTMYYMMTDMCLGGSPRFSIFLDLDGDGAWTAADAVIWAYLGVPPSFNGCSALQWVNTGNVLADGINRFDVSGSLGYHYAQTWAQVLAIVGNPDVYGIAFDVDSGWSFGTQTVWADDIQVNNHKFTNLSKGIRY